MNDIILIGSGGKSFPGGTGANSAGGVGASGGLTYVKGLTTNSGIIPIPAGNIQVGVGGNGQSGTNNSQLKATAGGLEGLTTGILWAISGANATATVSATVGANGGCAGGVVFTSGTFQSCTNFSGASGVTTNAGTGPGGAGGSSAATLTTAGFKGNSSGVSGGGGGAGTAAIGGAGATSTGGAGGLNSDGVAGGAGGTASTNGTAPGGGGGGTTSATNAGAGAAGHAGLDFASLTHPCLSSTAFGFAANNVGLGPGGGGGGGGAAEHVTPTTTGLGGAGGAYGGSAGASGGSNTTGVLQAGTGASAGGLVCFIGYDDYWQLSFQATNTANFGGTQARYLASKSIANGLTLPDTTTCSSASPSWNPATNGCEVLFAGLGSWFNAGTSQVANIVALTKPGGAWFSDLHMNGGSFNGDDLWIGALADNQFTNDVAGNVISGGAIDTMLAGTYNTVNYTGATNTCASPGCQWNVFARNDSTAAWSLNQLATLTGVLPVQPQIRGILPAVHRDTNIGSNGGADLTFVSTDGLGIYRGGITVGGTHSSFGLTWTQELAMTSTNLPTQWSGCTATATPTATASFAAGATSISVSGSLSGVTAGMMLYDTTLAFPVGTITTAGSGSIGLSTAGANDGAQTASSGSGDALAVYSSANNCPMFPPNMIASRGMGVVKCTNHSVEKVYGIIGFQLYERQDGASPTWTLKWQAPANLMPTSSQSALRSLTCLTPAVEAGDGILLVTNEGNPSYVFNVDIQTASVTPSACSLTAPAVCGWTFDGSFASVPAAGGNPANSIQSFLYTAWGGAPWYTITGYDNITLISDGSAIMGAEIAYAPGGVPPGHTGWTASSGVIQDAQASYFTRTAAGVWSVGQIPWLRSYPMVSIYNIFVSPFVQDPDALYFGGFDPNSTTVTNTGYVAYYPDWHGLGL